MKKNSFQSRKFLLALGGAVLGVCAKFLGVPPEVVGWITKLLGVYVGAETLLDLVAIKTNGNGGKK